MGGRGSCCVSVPLSFIAYRFSSHGEGDGTPLQYSCLESPMDGGAWWVAVHRVTKSQTQLSDFTFTFHFRALEKEMATHSSVLAWRVPGIGEPGGLPSMGSHRVGHDWSNLAAEAVSSQLLVLVYFYPVSPSLSVDHWRSSSTCLCFHSLPKLTSFGCIYSWFSPLIKLKN